MQSLLFALLRATASAMAMAEPAEMSPRTISGHRPDGNQCLATAHAHDAAPMHTRQQAMAAIFASCAPATTDRSHFFDT